MIARTRFFIASLWSSLAPVGMLVAVAVWVVLFPNLHGLGEAVQRASGMALISVPFAYTAIVVVTYGVSRGLYELRVLSRSVLIGVYGAAAVVVAVLMTWWFAAGNFLDIASSFALFLTLSLIASGSAAFVWWRVASRGVPDPSAPAEGSVVPRIRIRQRKRKSLFRRLANKL
jgi:hypothetical protein